ncbi:MAG: hypothetical protein M3069_00365 [Chloroflexota bacterium]|nr:hypothetical protein [Chloroflexota bacterium]
MIRLVCVEGLAVHGTVPWSDRTTPLRALLVAGLLFLAACSSGGVPSPTAPAASTGAPAKLDGVTAGVQIGSAPTAPAGWSPPTKITPVTELPGKFQSVADTPPPGDKVRVFFFGMQF